ncbi:hypothetical protein G5V59_11920 [Nocardioides sp. W3-2-3]|uniref:hypothetical protein n=1 Tax=Nocardioides convexus TaxID=2712224 RepID=UPI0024186B3C|nr:hypothetical protein [Nocardioides convexus]NHA00497.1 hypothetical protein [Nocardioides convexus]
MATAAVEARAGTTYTPAGGPSVRLVGTSISITDVPAGQTITCNQFDIAGTVESPGSVRTFGSAAVDLGALTYFRCTNPVMGPMPVTVDPAWSLDITGPATGTTWPAVVNHVNMRLAMANCDLRLAGTMPGVFDTATQRFTPTYAASTLVLTSVVGSMCVTLDWQVGDQMSFGGYLTNVPPAGSTPLSLT